MSTFVLKGRGGVCVSYHVIRTAYHPDTDPVSREVRIKGVGHCSYSTSSITIRKNIRKYRNGQLQRSQESLYKCAFKETLRRLLTRCLNASQRSFLPSTVSTSVTTQLVTGRVTTSSTATRVAYEYGEVVPTQMAKVLQCIVVGMTCSNIIKCKIQMRITGENKLHFLRATT